MAASTTEPRDFLIDVSRLIWRYWTRRLPTGIDRVCLAYLDHFGARALAVVQRGGRHAILSPRQSDALFTLLLADRPPSRSALALRLAKGAFGLRQSPRHGGLFYLNVGHTGLGEPTLPIWIKRNRLRAVYMVHDLIPLTHPQFCRPGEAGKHRLRIDNMLDSATGIIGNSQATLDDLQDDARANGRQLPGSVAAWISSSPAVVEVGAPPLDRPYFVILGTIEGRKNHLLLLHIWLKLVAELGGDAPTLVVIGQRGWEAEAAIALLDEPSAFAGRLLMFDRCSDAQLSAWLGGARALLMPSFAEGFGLPVIEALRQGTPVIASDLPVFREIAGGLPTFVDPTDADAWKGAIEAFVDDGPERTRQVIAMQTYDPPTWAAHFTIVESWLKSL